MGDYSTPDGRSKVADPMGKRVYSFDHEPTVAEMRAMAIRAMHDMLTIQWTTAKDFRFHKNNYDYIFDKGEIYGGLPYGSAQGTLASFMEYYDRETGALDIDTIGEGQEDLGAAVNSTVGNTCSGSTCWGLFTVCNSISGPCVCYMLTQKNGFIPVAPCTYDPALDSFENKGTESIISENGEETVCEAYGKVQPGDLLLYQVGLGGMGGHSVMVMTPPCVIRLEDGTIDKDKSYLYIHDQRMGYYPFPDSNGRCIKTSGRVFIRHSFRDLLDEKYIPLTTKEFLGEKPYEWPWVKLDREAETHALLSEARVISNYPVAVVKVMLTKKSGETKRIFLKSMSRGDIGTRLAFDYPLAEAAEAIAKAEKENGSKAELIAIGANGEEHTLYTEIF